MGQSHSQRSRNGTVDNNINTPLRNQSSFLSLRSRRSRRLSSSQAEPEPTNLMAETDDVDLTPPAPRKETEDVLTGTAPQPRTARSPSSRSNTIMNRIRRSSWAPSSAFSLSNNKDSHVSAGVPISEHADVIQEEDQREEPRDVASTSGSRGRSRILDAVRPISWAPSAAAAPVMHQSATSGSGAAAEGPMSDEESAPEGSSNMSSTPFPSRRRNSWTASPSTPPSTPSSSRTRSRSSFARDFRDSILGRRPRHNTVDKGKDKEKQEDVVEEDEEDEDDEDDEMEAPSSPPPQVSTGPPSVEEGATLPSSNANERTQDDVGTGGPGPSFFPAIPSGTTMIVQGVVQTSDGPSPPRSSSTNTSGSTPQSSDSPLSSNLNTVSDYDNATSNANAGTNTNVDSGTQTSQSLGPGGSIEMLGMLLSVATVATATSLLSPSSFSSSSSSPPTQTSNTLPIPPNGTGAQQRSLFSALRERIFHNASAAARAQSTSMPPPATPSSPPQSSSEETSTSTHPTFRTPTPAPITNATPSPVEALRESITSELTRALVLGGGGPAPSTTSPTDQPQSNTTPPQNQHQIFSSPPSSALLSGLNNESIGPEGSFERFLSDIQIELRRAVSGQPTPRLPSLLPSIPTAALSQVQPTTTPVAPVPEEMSNLIQRPAPPPTVDQPVNWWRMHRFAAREQPVSSPSNSDLASDGNERTRETTTVIPAIVVGLRSTSSAIPNNNNTTAETETRNGTRSYVIWVIGGYYPPGHPMLLAPGLVLGQFDQEDFWALAELLGQVKPTVASKEDIENSGLEVVKVPSGSKGAAKMKELEEEGKIAGNTVDRCLICLAEYDDSEPPPADPSDEEEVEIRIMSCKHAFHKDCVDRWLETGNNNCPACRTKGVKTEETSVPSPTTADATGADEDSNITSPPMASTEAEAAVEPPQTTTTDA